MIEPQDNNVRDITRPKLSKRIANSRRLAELQKIPPIGWFITQLAASLIKIRRRASSETNPPVNTLLQQGTGLEVTLQRIVHGVVHGLGYAGAMVATYEPGDALPVRAFEVDPLIIKPDEVKELEERINRDFLKKRTIFSDPTDPDCGKVYVFNDEYKENLSVKAVQQRQPVLSDCLYDLFVPFAPEASKQTITGIQLGLGIKKVIAIPFFLDGEVVGNLFAAKQGDITEQDVRILSAFGAQAASAIESEQRRLLNRRFREFLLAIHKGLRDEQDILQRIAKGVVDDLGYVGAMVATYESDNSLPIRAFHVDPKIITLEEIQKYEKMINEQFMTKRVIFSNPADPEIGRVYKDRPEYRENLSVRAVENGEPVVSNELYDLFRPIAPVASAAVIKGVQDGLGIHQVIAVPFFLGDELVGNLFATTLSRSFSKREIELLKAFGQQAAAGIYNARLYRRAEEQRQAADASREVAQVFGKMAFGAAAAVHAFRNHVGVVSMQLELLYMEGASEEQRQEMLQLAPEVMKRLNLMTDMLNQLHEPWRAVDDVATNVNDCLRQASYKVISGSGVAVEFDLMAGLPSIYTATDMLTEAFRILIKNAVEAIQEENRRDGRLLITTRLTSEGGIEIHVKDNGSGMKPEVLENIFKLRWTTKQYGLGFGLFWAKDYFEGLGGSIAVTSQWLEGSDFQITLPVALEPAAMVLRNEPHPIAMR